METQVEGLEGIKDFWARVGTQEDTSVCWPWLGYVGKDDYGQVQRLEKTYRAHRVALALFQGIELPDAETLCLHSCDNKICCNPHHLRWGSRLDNARDAVERDRYYRGSGEKNSMAKLSDAQVEEIRRRHAAGGVLQKALAVEYKVTAAAISKIVRNKMR